MCGVTPQKCNNISQFDSCKIIIIKIIVIIKVHFCTLTCIQCVRKICYVLLDYTMTFLEVIKLLLKML